MAYEFLKDKSILVTGGTGSFGQKFIKTLLALTEARRIIIFSRDELKQSQMMAEISDPEGRLRFFIGDIRDLARLNRAFKGVDYVVHAAALKQVPALEYNPGEAIKTNILGTENIVSAALDQGVEKVLLVSTDKAAGPANLYGATKLCAEKLFISSNVYAPEENMFSVVRYGNVIGSRGSILQVIEKQRVTGEITLTHEDMTRFWITLDHGVQLVLSGLEQMHGGEIFIPKIPSMKVKDFIANIAPECRLVPIGIRPGEKLHEVLVTEEEARHAREDTAHYVILPASYMNVHKHYEHLPSVPDGFHFTSDTNTEWLNADSLNKLLESL
jgi:UDP-N-acetylglucosamine 4,6-dehydratase/5-epimerase